MATCLHFGTASKSLSLVWSLHIRHAILKIVLTEFLTRKYGLQTCIHGGIVSSNTVFEKIKEYSPYINVWVKLYIRAQLLFVIVGYDGIIFSR